MKPWDIIGWSIIAIVVGGAVIKLLAGIAGFVYMEHRRRKSKKIPLKPGQKWIQDGHPLWIKNEFTMNNGEQAFTVDTGGASWSTTQEEWRERCNNRIVWLEEE